MGVAWFCPPGMISASEVGPWADKTRTGTGGDPSFKQILNHNFFREKKELNIDIPTLKRVPSWSKCRNLGCWVAGQQWSLDSWTTWLDLLQEPQSLLHQLERCLRAGSVCWRGGRERNKVINLFLWNLLHLNLLNIKFHNIKAINKLCNSPLAKYPDGFLLKGIRPSYLLAYTHSIRKKNKSI